MSVSITAAAVEETKLHTASSAVYKGDMGRLIRSTPGMSHEAQKSSGAFFALPLPVDVSVPFFRQEKYIRT